MEFILQPLTLLTFFPLLGVLVLLFVPSDKKNILRWVALVTTLITFGISIWVLTLFDASNPDLQLVAKYDWITVAGWNIQYQLGMDGLEHPVASIDNLPHADLHPFNVDRGRRTSQGFHALLPSA